MALTVSSDDMREWFGFDDGIRDEELKADYVYRLEFDVKPSDIAGYFRLSWKFDEDQPYCDEDGIPNKKEFELRKSKWSLYRNISSSGRFAMMMCQWDAGDDDDDDDDDDDTPPPAPAPVKKIITVKKTLRRIVKP